MAIEKTSPRVIAIHFGYTSDGQLAEITVQRSVDIVENGRVISRQAESVSGLKLLTVEDVAVFEDIAATLATAKVTPNPGIDMESVTLRQKVADVERKRKEKPGRSL